MSTLLTPIVTQLELDRDRLSSLVNGTETDTVVLENRTEKSIAGQVKERIDNMAMSLTDAVDTATGAANTASTASTNATSAKNAAEAAEADAYAAQVAAEGARDLSQTYRADTETFFNNVNTMYPNITAARDAAVLAEANAETYRDDAQTYSISASNSANDALNHKTQAQDASTSATGVLTQVTTIKNDVFDIADDVINGIVHVDAIAPPDKLYPTETIVVDETVDVALVASAPLFLSDDVNFVSRTFTIEKYDVGLQDWTTFKTYTGTDCSALVLANTLDSAEQYRWNVKDTVEKNDRGNPTTITSVNTEWEPISFTQDTNQTREPYAHIDKPTITPSTNGLDASLTGDALTSTASVTHLNSVWLIREVATGITAYTATSATDLLSHSISLGVLSPNTQYAASVRYAATINGTVVFSEWADFVTFTTQSEFKDTSTIEQDISDIDGRLSTTESDINSVESRMTDAENDITTKRDSSNNAFVAIELTAITATSIDHTNASLFTVDATTNPTLTITTPPASTMVDVRVHLTGTGTVAWPAGISWDGGLEPTLGSTFTLVKLVWIGSGWIGFTEASN